MPSAKTKQIAREYGVLSTNNFTVTFIIEIGFIHHFFREGRGSHHPVFTKAYTWLQKLKFLPIIQQELSYTRFKSRISKKMEDYFIKSKTSNIN